MNNCFEGRLTPECATCEFWKDTDTIIGCVAPFPIAHCEAFNKQMINDLQHDTKIHG